MSNGNGVTATLAKAADFVRDTASYFGSVVATTADDAVTAV